MICSRCGKALEETEFYDDVVGNRMDVCKKCATMDLNVYDPFETPDLFQYLDIPIIEEQWWGLVERYYIPQGMNATAQGVFGRYRSKMKLMSFRHMRYSDTDWLNGMVDRRNKLIERYSMGVNY